MAVSKKLGSYTEVRVDGVDASDKFDGITLEFNDEEVPAPSFNSGGFVEVLAGQRAQAIVASAYYTEELYDLLYPLYANRTTFEIGVQPNGLVDNTRETYVGNVRLVNWPATFNFGQADKAGTLRFVAADNSGITATTGS